MLCVLTGRGGGGDRDEGGGGGRGGGSDGSTVTGDVTRFICVVDNVYLYELTRLKRLERPMKAAAIMKISMLYDNLK